jgi:hypothetical protein
LGQTGLAQAHLCKNGVTVGDVFLFFGLLRRQMAATGITASSATSKCKRERSWRRTGQERAAKRLLEQAPTHDFALSGCPPEVSAIVANVVRDSGLRDCHSHGIDAKCEFGEFGRYRY